MLFIEILIIISTFAPIFKVSINQKSSMKHTSIGVVGGGLVGSMLSILLAKRGHDVHLYERRPDITKKGYIGGRSINLAMSTRGWRAAEQAGIAEQLRPHALPMYGRMMHDVKGQCTYQAYGKDDQAIWSVSRAGLNLALLELAKELPNINIVFDHICTDYDLNTQEITFETPENKAFKTTHEVVFATDGAYSGMRNTLMRRPMFNYSQTFLEHGYNELTISAGPNGAFQIQKDALHIWPRGNFMIIALPNPSGDFTCTLFLPFKGEVSYESLKTDADTKRFFETYFPDLIALMPDYLTQFNRNPASPLVTIHSDPWNYKSSLLIGDAAHAIVPFYGQGMNAGFEDCVLLDQAIENANEKENWETLFERYAQSRVPDADAIAQLALRNFVEMRDLVADPMFLLRKKISAHLHQQHPERFVPVYTLVSFSHTPYHLALKEEDKQNDMFKEILALPNIAENWQTNPKLINIFNRYYRLEPTGSK